MPIRRRLLPIPVAVAAFMALGVSQASACPPRTCSFSNGLTTCVDEASSSYTTAHLTTGTLPPDDSIPAQFCRLQHPELILISYDADASFLVVETTTTTTVYRGKRTRGKPVSTTSETNIVEVTAIEGRASCAFADPPTPSRSSRG
jgi:hypothetical protein